MEEESIEQLFAEVAGYLVLLDEVEIPRIEAKIHDLRRECQQVYAVLEKLEARVIRPVKQA